MTYINKKLMSNAFLFTITISGKKSNNADTTQDIL